MRVPGKGISIILTACSLVACSSASKDAAEGAGGIGFDPNANDPSSTGTGGSGSNGAGILSGADGRRPGAGSQVTPVRPGDECTGTTFEGEPLPLDMLIMMDRSVSMGDSEARYMIPGG